MSKFILTSARGKKAKKKGPVDLLEAMRTDKQAIKEVITDKVYDLKKVLEPFSKKKNTKKKRQQMEAAIAQEIYCFRQISSVLHNTDIWETTESNVANAFGAETIDVKLLQPNKYKYFCAFVLNEILNDDGSIYKKRKTQLVWNYDDNKYDEIVEENLKIDSWLENLLKKYDTTRPQHINLYEGDVLCLELLIVKSGEYIETYGQIGVKVDESRFDSVFDSFGASSSNVKQNLIYTIYSSAIKLRPVPRIFQKELSEDKPIKAGLYKNGDFLIYIPTLSKNKDLAQGVEECKAYFSGERETPPANKIHVFDSRTDTLLYFQNGRIVTAGLSNLSKPDSRFKLTFLEKNWGWFEDRPYIWNGSEAIKLAVNNLKDALKAEYGTFAISSIKLPDFIDRPEAQKILRMCFSFVIKEKYGQYSVLNFLNYLGEIKLMQSFEKGLKELVETASSRLERFNNCTADMAPELPNMSEKAVQFPHQAEALAKLNIATDIAILDVGTGGGKSGILIQDCINLMNQGKVTRPLMIMPNALVPQFLSSIEFFTAGKMNGFALTSDVEASYASKDDTSDTEARDRLLQKAKSTPKNTIFVTTFSWLIKGRSYVDYDINGNAIEHYEYPMSLRKELGIDYVAVDESQNIKKRISKTFRAVNDLGAGLSYKRISTGTLISNRIEDLIGQLWFLDPQLVGTEKQFKQNYGTGKSKGFTYSSAQALRQHLNQCAAYVMYREKDWAPLLPKRVYSFKTVKMTNLQKKIYNQLVSAVLKEITDIESLKIRLKDPTLTEDEKKQLKAKLRAAEKIKKAWEKMQKEGAAAETMPICLLGKLSKLERYLSAPDSTHVIKYVTDEQGETDKISPKVKAVDELIAQSIGQPNALLPITNNKVIVAVHYKDSAKHLQKNSAYSKCSAYYDASNKELIPKFQDPKSGINVLFAVQQSLKEGLNLQIANRIIIADVDWTPGNLKQLEARIFRPDPEIITEDENGNVLEKPIVKNHNEGKVVYIDTILVNNSADLLKLAFQTYKKVMNATIMEGYNPLNEYGRLDTNKLPPRVKINEKNLMVTAENEDPDDEGYIINIMEKVYSSMGFYNKWNQDEIDAFAKNDLEYKLVKHLKDANGNPIDTLGTERCDVPWIPGMTLPASSDEKPLLDYLNQLGMDENEFVETEDEESEDVSDTSSNDDEEDDDVSMNDNSEEESEEDKEADREADEDKDSDLRKKSDDLVGLKVRGEAGEGVIISVRKLTVRVAFNDGRKIVLNPAVLVYKVDDEGNPIFDEENTPSAIDDVITQMKDSIKEEKGNTNADEDEGEEEEIDTSDSSTDKNVIKEYFEDNDVEYHRRRNKDNDTHYCQISKDGNTIIVLIDRFNDITLGKWKEFVEMLEEGKSGTYTATGRRKIKGAILPPSVKPKALPKEDEEEEPKPKRGRKALDDKKTSAEPKPKKTLDDYIDDIDNDTNNIKNGKGGKSDKVNTTVTVPNTPKPKKTDTKKTVKTTVAVPAPAPKTPKPKKADTSTTAVTVSKPFKMRFGSYNNIPSLICIVNEKKGAALAAEGFEWSGPVWLYKVTNLTNAETILARLVKSFKVPKDCHAALEKCLSEYNKKVYLTEIPEKGVEKFLLADKRIAKDMVLRVYPLVIGKTLYFAVRKITNPRVVLEHFMFDLTDGYYIQVCMNKASAKSKFNKLAKKFAFDDIEKAKELAAEHLKIA